MAIFFAKVFVLLAQVLSAIGVVTGLMAKTVQEHIPFQVESTVVSTALNVANPTFGLDAAYAQRVDIISRLTVLQASVTAIPTAPQLASQPVHLPTVPPAGYGTGSTMVPSDVWGFLLSPGPRAAGDLLVEAGWTGLNMGSAAVPFPVATSKYFVQYGTWSGSVNPEGPTHGPIFPISAILMSDTLDVFLERESFYTGWTARGDGTWVAAMGDGDFFFATTITSDEFLVLRDGPSPPMSLAGKLLPVWPGILNVTLGSPVALAPGVTIVAAMDGIIISLSGVPTRSNFWQFDDKPSYRNLGALSFFNDDNEQEVVQILGFEQQIYTPKSMSAAAGVKLRTSPGVTGTVTPWHRTVP